MADHNHKEQSKLSVKDIARPKSVIHPALDWVNGQLVVGVVFENGSRAALTSKDGLVEIEKIGNVCERDGKFESPVTPEMAEQFMAYLETNPTSCPREELSALLLELAAYFNQFVVFPERHWSRVMASWTFGTFRHISLPNVSSISVPVVDLPGARLREVASRSDIGQALIQRGVHGVSN